VSIVDDRFNLATFQSVRSDSGDWYKCIQRLGAGGNAVTFLVIATSGKYQGLPFALKVFRRISKPERRDSFLREIDFLQQCDPPSVMRV
jgi:hypothetical protein